MLKNVPSMACYTYTRDLNTDHLPNNVLSAESHQSLDSEMNAENKNAVVDPQKSESRKRARTIKVEYEDDTCKPSTSLSSDTQTLDMKSGQQDEYSDSKKSKWEPPLWKQQLLNIYEMRRFRDAAVDTMGCDRISDKSADPKVMIQTGIVISVG